MLNDLTHLAILVVLLLDAVAILYVLRRLGQLDETVRKIDATARRTHTLTWEMATTPVPQVTAKPAIRKPFPDS